MIGARVDTIPHPVLQYISDSLLKRRLAAYLVCDASGALARWGGSLERYVTGRSGAAAARELLDGALAGYAPHDGPPSVLQFVHLRAGVVADVHVFLDGAETWVLLLDARAQHDERETAQLAEYERYGRVVELERVLRQFFGGAAAQLDELADSEGDGAERFDGAVVSARVKASPRALAGFAKVVEECARERGGTLESIGGECFTLVFRDGDGGAAAGDAVEAARALLLRVELDASVGVASGSIVRGMPTGSRRRWFAVLGETVERARTLSGCAERREILVDAGGWAAAASRLPPPTETRRVGGEEIAVYRCWPDASSEPSA